jgi:thiamine biosynthesis lipoprotein
MLKTRISGGSVVTSGIYERGLDLDGVRYHHLLSPETGWPVQNELASVTILSESSMEGDALATAAFILGTEKGLELINSLEGIEAVFIARDRGVTYSSGAKDYIIQ